MKYAIVITLVLAAGCSRQQKQPAVEASTEKKREPVEVQVARAEQRRIDRSILVTGSLLPDETATMVSEVAGRLSSIRFDFGQSVRKGDVIAEIDKTEYQLQLERSKAALAQALARLGLDATQAEKAPATTPAMKQAWAQMEDSRFRYESAQKLVKSGDISQERFNELEKGFYAREAAFQASRDEMRTLWASVETLKADMRLVEKRLRDTVIYAPFDASVAERKAAPGQYIKENTAILTLVKPHPLRLRLEVPESAAGVVSVGTGLEFSTDAVAES
ncbi:MAG: efflux RND transporter periplasmic adaptor subunit, partial [Acidobacteria bacterium]|nr:efflux RND transporter periplasmic adaptor subunit [Acidobacteriota bacterium]